MITIINKHLRIVLVVMLSIICFKADNCNGVDEKPKPFVLAYIDQNWKLQIRWSENGSTWQSASVGHTEIDRGPGLACDDAGVIYLSVFGGADSKARYNMGIGCSEWDNSSRIIGDGRGGEIRSATSIVYLDGTKYLISFLNSTQAKFYIFNTSTSSRDFENDITPVIGVENSNIEDHPALIRLNDKILVGWVLKRDAIQLVNGKIELGVPVWDPGYILNVPETGFYSPESVIDLATDGERYYLAFLRKGYPDGNELYPFSVFIYTSTNGMNWTKLSSFSTNRIKISVLSIAASSPNNVIAIISSGASKLSFTKVKRYNGSTWSEIATEQVYGSNLSMAGHDLTLFKRY